MKKRPSCIALVWFFLGVLGASSSFATDRGADQKDAGIKAETSESPPNPKDTSKPVPKAQCGLDLLISSLSHYKTTNIQFPHAGHLLAHSLWTAWAIDSFVGQPDRDERLLENHAFWLQGLSPKDVSLVYLGAFVHDVGKAIATSKPPPKCVLSYFAYPKHPRVGFEYLTNQRGYPLCEAGSTVTRFLALGDYIATDCSLSRVQLLFLAVITGMHYDLGNVMKGARPQAWVDKFNALVAEAQKLLGVTIDSLSQRKLAQMCLAVSAADNRGNTIVQSRPPGGTYPLKFLHLKLLPERDYARPGGKGSKAYDTDAQHSYNRFSYFKKGVLESQRIMKLLHQK